MRPLIRLTGIIFAVLAAAWVAVGSGFGPAAWCERLGGATLGPTGERLELAVTPRAADGIAVELRGPPGWDWRFVGDPDVGPTPLDREHSAFLLPANRSGGFGGRFDASGKVAAELPRAVVPESGVILQAAANPPGGAGGGLARSIAVGVRADGGQLAIGPVLPFILRRRGGWLLIVLAALALLWFGRRWPGWTSVRGRAVVSSGCLLALAALAAFNADDLIRRREVDPTLVLATRDEQLSRAFEPLMPLLVERGRAAVAQGERVLAVATDPPALKLAAALRLLVPGISLEVAGDGAGADRFDVVLYLGDAARSAPPTVTLRAGAFAIAERSPR